jgi:hypothetical protein
VLVTVLLFANPANATVTGPCTAELSGVPVTRGHDTPGTAVRVDYRQAVTYGGRASRGTDVTGALVRTEIVGIDLRITAGTARGSTWLSTVDVSRYAWAGVGLYRVSGIASAGDRPLCQGVVYVCVDGKAPFLTAAGGTSVGFGVISIVLLARGLAKRNERGRGLMAATFGVAGLVGGAAALVLLQQSCVLPLDVLTAVGFGGGGLLGMTIVGGAVAGGAPASAPAEAAPAAVPAGRSTGPDVLEDRQG